MITPHEECELANEVKRNETNQVVETTFQNLEKAKDDPVSQPESVIFFISGFNRLERKQSEDEE